MKFCLGAGREESGHEVAQIARSAEELGFSTFHVVDQPQLSRDVHVLLAATALATQSIRIGQGVTQLATVHPVVMANATATIDELSGGRAFLGIGTGGYALFTPEGK